MFISFDPSIMVWIEKIRRALKLRVLGDYKRILILAGVMAVVATTVALTAIWLLYTTALDAQKGRLIEIAKSRARMIEAVARFDKAYSKDYPGGAMAATIAQIVDAHEKFSGFGDSGEFTLAKRDGDHIVFILSHRHHDLKEPLPVPFQGKKAEPMRRALSGKTGTVIGLDYRNTVVLAAYEPVKELNLGIVAKIDMEEVRSNFVSAFFVTGGVSFLIIGFGMILFFRFGEPLVSELRTAQVAAEKANRAKSDFLAHMSHELRTPLNAIIGFAQMMANEALGRHSIQRYREYAVDIQRSGEHVVSIVNDLLDLSKVEAEKIDFDPIKFPLGEAIDECIKVFGYKGDENSRRFHVHLSRDTEYLHADERIFKQIMFNLLSNAIKYTSGNGDIQVLSARSPDGATVIKVKDTGIGIAKHDIPLVLEPFGQARANAEIAHEGTGLGLPLAKKLTELHGGRLDIESELKEGTTVILTFPSETKEK